MLSAHKSWKIAPPLSALPRHLPSQAASSQTLSGRCVTQKNWVKINLRTASAETSECSCFVFFQDGGVDVAVAASCSLLWWSRMPSRWSFMLLTRIPVSFREKLGQGHTAGCTNGLSVVHSSLRCLRYLYFSCCLHILSSAYSVPQGCSNTEFTLFALFTLFVLFTLFSVVLYSVP